MDSNAKGNAVQFLATYKELLNHGVERAPRGAKTKELINHSFTIKPSYPFTSFNARNLNVSYLAAELLWYMVGDRYDLSICSHGSMWTGLIQKDNGLNSNYGQTIFGVDNQFDWVVDELTRDKDSRRAVWIIGEKDYLSPDINDQRCCQFIQFLIRDNILNCYVHFRSSDAIWGMTNDVFTLCELFKYVYVALKQYNSKLKLGDYTQTAVSFHVYERHFAMLEKIVAQGLGGFYDIYLPQLRNTEEVMWVREQGHRYEKAPAYFSYVPRLIEMVDTNK